MIKRLLKNYWLYSPNWFFALIKTLQSFLFSGGDAVIVFPFNNAWVSYGLFSNLRMFTPTPKKGVSGKKYLDLTYDKYKIKNFVEVKTGDTVFDIGAFVGGFTIPAAKIAKSVYAFEPTPISANCLRKNVAHLQNVLVLENAFWNKKEELCFLLGENPTDNSLINLDDGKQIGKLVIEADTLDNIAQAQGISCIDFLKADVEGAEPELIEGIKDVIVKQIAIDCGEERYGKSTINEVKKLLVKKNYEVTIIKNIVFAKLK